MEELKLIKDINIKQFSFTEMIDFAEYCKRTNSSPEDSLIEWVNARNKRLNSLIRFTLINIS